MEFGGVTSTYHTTVQKCHHILITMAALCCFEKLVYKKVNSLLLHLSALAINYICKPLTCAVAWGVQVREWILFGRRRVEWGGLGMGWGRIGRASWHYASLPGFASAEQLAQILYI